MHQSMPPLSALRAFEAAARHLSFTQAAAELNVTPGALSHQIRGLEEYLGVQLFERRTRAIALTSEGRTLYPGLQAGFGLIRDAVGSLRAMRDPRVLVISTPPGLTSKWLIARLYRFTDAHPDSDVRVSSSASIVNFATDGVDVAIRHLALQHEEDPGLHYEKLVDVPLTVVCSPALLKRLAPLDPAALKKAPLIHDDSLAGKAGAPNWQEWASQTGTDIGDTSRGTRFSSADHAIAAALQGAGLLLTHKVLAHDDLEAGRLVAPLQAELAATRAYYFVAPKAKLARRLVSQFRDWVRDEVSTMAQVRRER